MHVNYLRFQGLLSFLFICCCVPVFANVQASVFNDHMRLVLAAEGIVYGQSITYSGPIYDQMKVEGNNVRVSFKHKGEGSNS